MLSVNTQVGAGSLHRWGGGWNGSTLEPVADKRPSVFSAWPLCSSCLRNHIFLVNRFLGPVPQHPLRVPLSIAIPYEVSPSILGVGDNFLSKEQFSAWVVSEQLLT